MGPATFTSDEHAEKHAFQRYTFKGNGLDLLDATFLADDVFYSSGATTPQAHNGHKRTGANHQLPKMVSGRAAKRR
jgi:hypothetical protein